jgi:putative heme-binding domain-containing protein
MKPIPARPAAGDLELMRAAFLAVALTFLASIAFAAPPENVASTAPRTPAEEVKAFHLPEGFVAELVASEPEIYKPLNIAFDDQGRLWVTDTIEYPFPVPEGKPGRDGVKILSDFGQDGRARKITTFTTGLNIPIGLLPMPGGREALIHSIPDVFKFTDTDGDGRADKKEPLYETYGHRDTHGMTNAFSWGFDGWIYACHGFSNESTVKGRDGRPITMQSGNTYRMRPDGSHLEYFTHGQVNPFGLAFDPLGNLYSCDCHSRPIYQLLRGAWYPSFGKPHDGLGFGPEMVTHDHGSTGIGGIAYYAADHFPKAYRDRVFIGNVVTSRINQDAIEWHGSSPKGIEQPDFLVSDDPWFRPVDIELGPDGALYVADFYNRIIGHYEVPLTHPGRDRERGRIWRIVYRGKDGKNAPAAPRARWSSASNAELIEDLGHPNLTVRMMAANQLAGRPEPGRPASAVQAVVGLDKNTERRVHALWVLQRWGELTEERLLRAAIDPDRAVRVHAMRILSERPTLDGALVDVARGGLKDEDPFVRRAAAEALGRHPGHENVLPLLSLRESTPADDTHLIHVVRMALRDQFLSDDAWAKLDALAPTDRQRADIADIAPGVPSAAAARFLFAHVKRTAEPHAPLVRYVHHIARHGVEARDGSLLAYLLLLASNPEASKQVGGLLGQVDLIKAFQQGLQERGIGLNDDARKFSVSLTESLLGSSRGNEVLAGINLAGAFRLAGARDRLATVAMGDSAPEGQRLEALSALSAIDPKAAQPVLTRVLTDPTRPLSIRDRAATLLAAANQPEAQAALIAALPTAPERIQTAIAAALATRKAGALALLDAVASGKASARLLQENRVAGPLGNAGVPDLADRLAKLLHGLPPADQKVRVLVAVRRAGFGRSKADAAAGAKVFETSCAACHQIGGKGGKVGPNLDGIGQRGVDRILEDVLDPSRNVDQAFRLTTLALKDGQVVSGLLLREEGEVLVVGDSQGKEVRVPKGSVEERKITPLSPMPANFSEQVPEPDFYRLIAYLLSQRPPQ